MPFTPPPPLKSGLFGRRGPAPQQTQAVASTGATLPPPKPPGGVRVEDRIGVQAPPEVIWEIIHDLDRWAEWNPTYPRAAGEIRIGGTLDLTFALPGQPPQQLKPTVLDWVPGEQLHWRLRMMGGAIRTLRYVEIEKLGEANCVVDNGEIFGGLMGPSLARRIGRNVQRGFRTMNEALKARAEATWAAQRG